MAMIEAFQRLTEKLDQVSAAVAQQVQAMQQMRAPLSPNATGQPPEEAVEATRTTAQIPVGASIRPESERSEIPRSPDSELPTQDGIGAPRIDSTSALAENARHLVDTLSRSRDDWQSQAADLEQALGAIMDFLENQAAANTTKSDLNEIMNRLRNLEEEQRNLNSQFSSNRWGGS